MAQNPTSDIRDPTSPPTDRGHLLTEQRLDASRAIDALSVEDALRVINDEDTQIAGVVREAIPAIARLVDDIVAALRAGGRLIYIGAGTSGRLGVLDASECPPTFHSDPNQVIGIIAGGDAALRKSSEGMEDDPDGAHGEFDRLGVGKHDVVVGIAAGGTTPYVLGGLALAKAREALTALMTCAAPPSEAQADHVIALPVGPEVVTGSTRMKAGTATKLALNMITTTTMIQLGKTWGNLMVDLRATNAKLRDRAVRIIVSQCDVDRDAALRLLDEADGRVKVALVMAKRGADVNTARTLIDAAGGKLREILGEPL